MHQVMDHIVAAPFSLRLRSASLGVYDWAACSLAHLVGRVGICSTPPCMIEPAVLFVCAKGASANNVLLCITTRIEDVAEPSRFAGRMVSTGVLISECENLQRYSPHVADSVGYCRYCSSTGVLDVAASIPCPSARMGDAIDKAHTRKAEQRMEVWKWQGTGRTKHTQATTRELQQKRTANKSKGSQSCRRNGGEDDR